MVVCSPDAEGWLRFTSVLALPQGDGKSLVNLRERRDTISHFNMIDLLIVLGTDCEK